MQVVAGRLVQPNPRQRLRADDGTLRIGAPGAIDKRLRQNRAFFRPRRIGVVLQRGRSLRDYALEDGELGFRLNAAGHQANKVAGAHGASAGHFPGGGPAEGARHGVVEFLDIIQQE